MDLLDLWIFALDIIIHQFVINSLQKAPSCSLVRLFVTHLGEKNWNRLLAPTANCNEFCSTRFPTSIHSILQKCKGQKCNPKSFPRAPTAKGHQTLGLPRSQGVREGGKSRNLPVPIRTRGSRDPDLDPDQLQRRIIAIILLRPQPSHSDSTGSGPRPGPHSGTQNVIMSYTSSPVIDREDPFTTPHRPARPAYRLSPRRSIKTINGDQSACPVLP